MGNIKHTVDLFQIDHEIPNFKRKPMIIERNLLLALQTCASTNTSEMEELHAFTKKARKTAVKYYFLERQ
jgi:hypothetical protein